MIGRTSDEPSTAEVTTLVEGKLYAVSSVYRLDGREASHPTTARGWTAAQCYVLLEADHAALLNTGYTVHGEALVAELRKLVGDRPLSLVIARVEFPSMCNARRIADCLQVDTVWQRFREDASTFLNFHPEDGGGRDGLREVETRLIERDVLIPVDRRSRRQVLAFTPALRLLPCNWLYDGATRTLFTGDVFGWTSPADRAGPWVLDDCDADGTTTPQVADFMLSNRYWWLAGARTDALRDALDDVFTRYDVHIVAPDNGCVLVGAQIVARHRALLDSVLRDAADMPSQGLDVAHWPIGGTR
jgi:hypothetical protein